MGWKWDWNGEDLRLLRGDLLRVLALGNSRIKAGAISLSSSSWLWKATQKLLVRRNEPLNWRSLDMESHQNSLGLGRQEREPERCQLFSAPSTLVSCQKEWFSLYRWTPEVLSIPCQPSPEHLKNGTEPWHRLGLGLGSDSEESEPPTESFAGAVVSWVASQPVTHPANGW